MRIWSFAGDTDRDDMMDVYNAFSFDNEDEIDEALNGGKIGGPKVYDFPLVKARFLHPDFAPDFFYFNSLVFVSKKMHLLLEIDPDFVSYFDVDTSESAPCIQAMEYKVMFNRAKEDVMDMDKSIYTEVRVPKVLKGLVSGRDYDKIICREDIKVKSHLFTDASNVCARNLCTDYQAMKLLAAGCTGFRCWDTRQLKLFREPRKFRTLQGLAEEGPWDPVRKVELTRMVEWF
jgi:hypothetical protein